jgi:hypothetical protein
MLKNFFFDSNRFQFFFGGDFCLGEVVPVNIAFGQEQQTKIGRLMM